MNFNYYIFLLFATFSCINNPPYISGSATFDRYAIEKYTYYNTNLAKNVTTAKLNYTKKILVKAKNIAVQIVDQQNIILAKTSTDSYGDYFIQGGFDSTAKVQLASQLTSSKFPLCNNLQYSISVVDNTNAGKVYTFEKSVSNQESLMLYAQANYGFGYTQRTSAPFAILDSIRKAIVFLCRWQIVAKLPPLQINFSESNIAQNGDVTLGEVSSSHYELNDGIHKIFLLGKEDVNTDEFDESVVIHEFFHFLETTIYNKSSAMTNSTSGSHQIGQNLDPRLAFSEGMANAFSAMVLGNDNHLNSFGDMQNDGLVIDMLTLPSFQEQTIYSELTSAYALLKIFRQTNTFTNIHQVLLQQKNIYALKTLHSFFSIYKNLFPSDNSIQALWQNQIGQPYDSLCLGFCTNMNDTADYFDQDNDLGLAYSTGKYYPQDSSNLFDANFWRLYKKLNTFINNSYEYIRFGGYSYTSNKMGSNKYYTYQATTSEVKMIQISNLKNTANVSQNCNLDLLDISVWHQSNLLSLNEDKSGSNPGCPTVTFTAQTNEIYIIILNGLNIELNSFDITITPL